MKITIDTAHDSHMDIRKVIRMLQHLVGEEQQSSSGYSSEQSSNRNIFESSEPATPSMFGMFDSTPAPAQQSEPAPSMMGMFDSLPNYASPSRDEPVTSMNTDFDDRDTPTAHDLLRESYGDSHDDSEDEDPYNNYKVETY